MGLPGSALAAGTDGGLVSLAWALPFAGLLLSIALGPVLAPWQVNAIAEDRGVAMPGFFGHTAWSGCVLLPLFGLMTFIWMC